jgi:hypothetical protein
LQLGKIKGTEYIKTEENRLAGGFGGVLRRRGEENYE